MIRRTFLALAAAGILSAAQVPRQAPDLPIRLTDGRVLKLSEFRGKVVALEFLLTTCPHCQRSSQVMNKLQKELGPRGFQAIGIAINPMANMLVPDYVKQFGLVFPVGFDDHDVANDFLQHSVLHRMLMPQLVFIDRKGVIRAQYSGDDKFFADGQDEQNVRNQVEELLKEPAPASTSAAPGRKKS